MFLLINNQMDKFLILFLSISLAFAKIKINDLKVPKSIESGTVDSVILDCDFETDGENDIEVKWYWNDLVQLIYQWIPDTNRTGQALGRFKGLIDVNYRISEERDKMYRALHLVNVSPELSGNYSCKVSGPYTEDVVTKTMIIYEPADSGLQLEVTSAEKESAAFCTAEGLYPEPILDVFLSDKNGSKILAKKADATLTKDTDSGFFNITSILIIDSKNISSAVYNVVCELTIPGTSYTLHEIKSHLIANKSTMISSSLLYLAFFTTIINAIIVNLL